MPDSWRLKVERAKQHVVDLEKAAKRYADIHPYEFVRVRLPDHKRQVMFRLRITEQPDPQVALVLGDFVHNLRSALDHIMGGLVPSNRRSNAEFPVSLLDFRAKDANGDFVIKDGDGRKKFESSIKGVEAGAEAIIIGMQPYHYRGQAFRHPFSLLSRLDNLDKHHELIVLGFGVRNLTHTRTVGNHSVTEPHPLGPTTFIQDGKTVWFHLSEDSPPPSKMNVQYRGTAEIYVCLPGIGGGKKSPPMYFPLTAVLDGVNHVTEALDKLEPFVRR